MYPVVPKLSRQAGKDLVVPLHDTTFDRDGNPIHEVVLKKNMRVFMNIVAYNRHPDLWGPDPNIFRPERWFEMKESKIKFGVYGNL